MPTKSKFNPAQKGQAARLAVRQIVTRSGRGVRGHFPSYKAVKRLQFQSLVEEDALRVMEIASSTSKLKTQPDVFVLPHESGEFRYTPDTRVVWKGKTYYVEVKADRFTASSKTVMRLWRIRAGMRAVGLLWRIVLEHELRAANLQTELKELLRMRPAPRRQRNDLNPCAWDPVLGTQPSEDVAARWVRAKAECDALLLRVMRRDPGDVLPVAQD